MTSAVEEGVRLFLDFVTFHKADTMAQDAARILERDPGEVEDALTQLVARGDITLEHIHPHGLCYVRNRSKEVTSQRKAPS